MDTVHIANLLLTRRCNLACSYCNIVRNYKNMPSEYKKISKFKKDEISGEQWIEIIKRLVRNNPNVFFVIYGGEPFVYEDLWKIIKYCNENSVFYTIISNNTDQVQDKIKEVHEKCGQYRGFTSSVDPIIRSSKKNQIEFCGSEKGKMFITEKSNSGLLRLTEMVDKGWIKDAVAEITILRSTVAFLYDTVKELSRRGIYSSITTLDDPKNEYYDFARVSDMSEMVTKDCGIREEFDKLKSDKTLLLHMPELLDKIYEILPSNMFCSLSQNIHNVTIDADGTFRLCLRIRGVASPSLNLNDVINEDGVIQNRFKTCMSLDYNQYCKGCNWTCVIMSDFFSNQIIDHGPQHR
jgi:organic radical activating enzyme